MNVKKELNGNPNKRRRNMHKNIQLLGVAFILMTAFVVALSAQPALAATAAQIDRDVDLALEKLYANSPAAKELAEVAEAILVFPDVVKAGFIVGGQYGEGALRKDGKTVGYYNTIEASYGLQAGAQSFGYALFFVTDSALEHFEKSAGFEVGVGPTVVIVDEGLSRSLTTSTLKDDIYAFFFDQQGLMAGLGLKGSKISKIKP
jgi:lipid-binding SYLF domain-containing protein